MKFVDEFRDGESVARIVNAIMRIATRPWTIMEICGGQTHAIVKYGLDQLLPDTLTLIHGPGCPVCVTPAAMIDKAIDIAHQPGVIVASFGDMMRVPGSRTSLIAARALGAQVRLVYSPMDAVDLARRHQKQQIVFFAVGFETTAPATAMAAYLAKRDKLANFSMLVSHVLVPPAMEAILSSPANRVQGFLAAGHVCTVMGIAAYKPISARFGVPIVVTGFEPVDILQGIHMCLRQLEAGRHQVENQYARAVRSDGNPSARERMEEVFQIVPRNWRGIGEIPASGYGLSDAYADLDAERRFGPAVAREAAPSECISGAVLTGAKRPIDCPAFGTRCTPDRPIGAPMVSSEGACAAYYRYPVRSMAEPRQNVGHQAS